MTIEETEIAIIFKNEEKSIIDFFSDFSEKYGTFKNKNIILDFSLVENVDIKNILLFLQYSKQHRNNGMSFVIVVNGIDFEEVPDEIITVPTLIEAKDTVEMENIERDLGF
ncbi:MAG TPA: ribonuclease Z [Flavobacteriaceae bacterium]|jgi:predicted transcriptional regulator YdeE|nr:ribonuclease Z [Flavobacteriaceae bacterium]HBS11763.1 ribonuclease Z [Flavobacteriaceae bacterium]